jgi:hypothetical protein
VGLSPDTRLFEKIRHPDVKYSFTAITNTTLSLTYADLAEYRCDRVIANTANPWTFSVQADHPISNRTCLLAASPGPKSANITWLNCTSGHCGNVSLYGEGPKSTVFILNVTEPGTTQLFWLPSSLLLVIEPSTAALEVIVGANSPRFERNIMIDWPSEGVVSPKKSETNPVANLPTLILTALLALPSHIAIGFVWIREYKCTRGLLPIASPERSTDNEGHPVILYST